MVAFEALVAQNVFFGIIAASMIGAALLVVTTKNVVHAALALVVVLVGVAGQFVLLLAEFIAATQVLVYVGAIIVLFLFGIMLTQARIGRDEAIDHGNRGVALGTALVLAVVMGYALLSTFSNEDIRARVGGMRVQTTGEVADAIFGTYIIPFEAVSLLLLGALIGAIVMARRE
jgi:NADH-quinone oxidoreductase subunit J